MIHISNIERRITKHYVSPDMIQNELPLVGSRIMPVPILPKDVHILIPEFGNMLGHMPKGKRELRLQIELSSLIS